LAAGVIQRENWISKMYALMQRQIEASAFDKAVLKKIELKGVPELTLYTVVGPRIRSITENVVDIVNNQLAIAQKKINDSDLKKITRLGKMVHKILGNACEAFLNEDVMLASRTIASISTFVEETDELMYELSDRIKDPDLGKHLSYIVRDFRRISGYGRLISEVAIIGFVFHNS
jgi:phosphate uptake regulator